MTTREEEALKGYTDEQLHAELRRRQLDANEKFVKNIRIRQDKIRELSRTLVATLVTEHSSSCPADDLNPKNSDRCARCFLLTMCPPDGYVSDPDEEDGYLDLQLSLVVVRPPYPEVFEIRHRGG